MCGMLTENQKCAFCTTIKIISVKLPVNSIKYPLKIVKLKFLKCNNQICIKKGLYKLIVLTDWFVCFFVYLLLTSLYQCNKNQMV